MAAVFISQQVLTQWADAGKIELDDSTLLLVQEKRSVDLNPAVRFISVVGGDDDPHELLRKVKTRAQLEEMGAEHYMDSVIHGDVAYQVVEGFMGDLSAPRHPTLVKAPQVTVALTAAPVTTSVPRPISSLPQPASKREDIDRTPNRIESKSGALHEALQQAVEGKTIVDDENEADAAALTRLFLETVQ